MQVYVVRVNGERSARVFRSPRAAVMSLSGPIAGETRLRFESSEWDFWIADALDELEATGYLEGDSWQVSREEVE